MRAHTRRLLVTAAGVLALAVLAAACTSAGAAPSGPTSCPSGTPRAGAVAAHPFICVDSPSANATVGHAFTVSGRAANRGAFRVSVDLIDGSGLIATSGEIEFPNAGSAGHVRSWKIPLSVPADVHAGKMTIIARAFDTTRRSLGEHDVPVTLRNGT